MLQIVVCLKQVPDPLSVEIDALSGAINQARLVYITNHADAAALELALRWRETINDCRVDVVTCGPARADKLLREALAVGADNVTRVWSNRLSENSPFATAKILAAFIQPLQPAVILCGTRSVDNASGQVPGYLAEFLGLVQATNVTVADFKADTRQIEVERKLERGKRERLRLSLPALLSVEAGIAELRYASFPALLSGQKAVIPVVEAVSVKPKNNVSLVEVKPPRPRPRQIFMPDPNLPAAARIEAILNGGAAIKQKKAGLIEGTPQEQAERILAFLEQHGLAD